MNRSPTQEPQKSDCDSAADTLEPGINPSGTDNGRGEGNVNMEGGEEVIQPSQDVHQAVTSEDDPASEQGLLGMQNRDVLSAQQGLLVLETPAESGDQRAQSTHPVVFSIHSENAPCPQQDLQKTQTQSDDSELTQNKSLESETQSETVPSQQQDLIKTQSEYSAVSVAQPVLPLTHTEEDASDSTQGRLYSEDVQSSRQEASGLESVAALVEQQDIYYTDQSEATPQQTPATLQFQEYASHECEGLTAGLVSTRSQQEAPAADFVMPEAFLPEKEQREAYFGFKEKIGRLSTSCGTSYAGDLLAVCSEEFTDTSENYLRGCKWSPDGQMLLTNSNDDSLRLFDIPNTHDCREEMQSRLKIPKSDCIYDFCWYPGMQIDKPETCLLLTTNRHTPMHLHSALTGELVASYLAYDHLDELVAAHSVGFTSDGRYLVAGFNKTLRCFNVDRPGRTCVTTATVVKEKDKKGRTVGMQGQRGILSCFAAHPASPSVVAAGSFTGDVALYDIPSGSMTVMFEGQSGGITHLVFSSDGNYLYAGGRKDTEINCFDIRNPEQVLFVLHRFVATNQRMYFDLDRTNRYLLSGNHNGKVSVWDLYGQTYIGHYSPWPQLDPIINFTAHHDSANGCSINPTQPILATCSGQRHFKVDILDDEEEEAMNFDDPAEENSVKLWGLKLPGT